MRRLRFLVSLPSNTSLDTLVGSDFSLSKEESHHLYDVLRLKATEQVELFCRRTKLVLQAEILVSSNTESTVLIRSFRKPEQHRTTRLILALLKPAKNELIVEKATELGISEIHFYLAERTQGNSRKQIDSQNRKRRLEGIRNTATKQCGTAVFTDLFFHSDLSTALKVVHLTAAQGAVKESRLLMSAPEILPYETENTADLQESAPRHQSKLLIDPESLEIIKKTADSFIIIGPEGGLSGEEQELCKNYSYSDYSLGPNILRAETAALLASGIVQQVASKQRTL